LMYSQQSISCTATKLFIHDDKYKCKEGTMNYSDNKHSLTHHSIYLFCTLHHSNSKVVPICYMFRLGRAIIRYTYKC
jgi:hypothetical protein